MNLCLCGVEASYPHAVDCPRPFFGDARSPACLDWYEEQKIIRARFQAIRDRLEVHAARIDRDAEQLRAEFYGKIETAERKLEVARANPSDCDDEIDQANALIAEARGALRAAEVLEETAKRLRVDDEGTVTA